MHDGLDKCTDVDMEKRCGVCGMSVVVLEGYYRHVLGAGRSRDSARLVMIAGF